MDAMSAFVGCFAALAVTNEIHSTNRGIKYAAALVAGIVATLVVNLAVNFVRGLFH